MREFVIRRIHGGRRGVRAGAVPGAPRCSICRLRAQEYRAISPSTSRRDVAVTGAYWIGGGRNYGIHRYGTDDLRGRRPVGLSSTSSAVGYVDSPGLIVLEQAASYAVNIFAFDFRPVTGSCCRIRTRRRPVHPVLITKLAWLTRLGFAPCPSFRPGRCWAWGSRASRWLRRADVRRRPLYWVDAHLSRFL